MGIITELGMGMERNGNWLHGNVKSYSRTSLLETTFRFRSLSHFRTLRQNLGELRSVTSEDGVRNKNTNHGNNVIILDTMFTVLSSVMIISYARVHTIHPMNAKQ